MWQFIFFSSFFFFLIYVASVCHLPMDPGDCDGICPRWFFNTHSGRCEEFSYGCCGGNANKFRTEQECLNACNNGTLLYYHLYLFMPAIPSGAYRPLTRFLQVLLSCALFFDNIINNELFHEQILRNNKAKADFELTLKCVTFFLNSRAFTRKIFCFITYRPR